MKTQQMAIIPEQIERLVLVIRGQKVMLDYDLARIYGVPTKAFNQAVKRNADRFPEGFVFQPACEEFDVLRSQIVTSKPRPGRGPRRYLPYAFTEHGAIMAANVLLSPPPPQPEPKRRRIGFGHREHVSKK